MLSFLDFIVDFIVLYVEYLKSMIDSLFAFVGFLTTFMFVPNLLIGILHPLLTACVTFVLGAGLAKMLLGR